MRKRFNDKQMSTLDFLSKKLSVFEMLLIAPPKRSKFKIKWDYNDETLHETYKGKGLLDQSHIAYIGNKALNVSLKSDEKDPTTNEPLQKAKVDFQEYSLEYLKSLVDLMNRSGAEHVEIMMVEGGPIGFRVPINKIIGEKEEQINTYLFLAPRISDESTWPYKDEEKQLNKDEDEK